MCTRNQRGFTLIELIVLIVVLSAAIAGVLLVFQNTVRGSVDPQINKQALAIAEGLLDEVLLSSYDVLPGTGSRANFDDVDDYNGYTTGGGGMRDIQNNLIPGLGAYNATVTVSADTLSGVGGPPGVPVVNEVKRVTVTVTFTGPPAISVALDGYRLRYVGP